MDEIDEKNRPYHMNDYMFMTHYVVEIIIDEKESIYQLTTQTMVKDIIWINFNDKNVIRFMDDHHSYGCHLPLI
jgi:hypothetical protein